MSQISISWNEHADPRPAGLPPAADDESWSVCPYEVRDPEDRTKTIGWAVSVMVTKPTIYGRASSGRISCAPDLFSEEGPAVWGMLRANVDDRFREMLQRFEKEGRELAQV